MLFFLMKFATACLTLGNHLPWVAKLVARLLATAARWVRILTSIKNKKMGVISKEVVNTV
jgi:hypothetical protein